MPRLGLDFALDSLGGGLGGFELCDYTTFYNGVALINDPFVDGAPATGPMKIDTSGSFNDAIVSGTIAYKFDVDDFFNIKFSFDAPTSGVERVYIFTNGSANIAIIIPTNLIPYLEVDNGTSTIILTSSTAVVQGQVYTIRFDTSGVDTNKSFTLYMDNVEVSGAQSIDMSGITLDKLTLGTKEDRTDYLDLSLYEIDSNQLGYTPFVSRLPAQNDPNGNKFFSDSTVPVTYTLNPQAPFTEYYPHVTTGFAWPDTHYVSDTYCGDCNLSTYWDGTSFVSFGFTGIPAVPATGPVDLSADKIVSTFTDDDVEATDWVLEFQANSATDNDFGDKFVVVDNSGAGVAKIDVKMRAPVGNNNWMQIAITNDAAVAVYSKVIQVVVSGIHTICVKYTTSTNLIEIEVDGVNTGHDAVLTATTPITLNRITWGANASGTENIKSKFYFGEFSIVDYWNFVGRLWTQSDVNGNKYIGLNNAIVADLSDNNPDQAVFPYIGKWATTYLVSDTPCAGNNLVTNNGIAVTNNGEFVINTP